MPSKRGRQLLNALQRRCDELRHEAGQLLSTRSLVCRKIVLLEALCESFAVYKRYTNKHAFDEASSSALCPEGIDDLLQHEQLLLSELQQLQSGNWDSAELPQLGLTTIAPRSDPLAMFRQHLAQAPSGSAVTFTARELAALYGNILLQAGVQLHLLKSSAPGVRDSSEARLQKLWEQYLPIAFSILMAGRPVVLEQFSTYNLSTLEIDPEAGQKHAAKLAALPPVLGLTEQQLQEITAGTSLFKDLLSNILREQLQHQQDLSSDTNGAGVSSSSSKPCDSSTSNSSSSSCTVSHRDLVGHQRSAGRMQALLRKEYCMRAAAGAWFGGCLSWQQLTKAAVICWPHPLQAGKLMLEVARYAQEQRSC